MPCCYFFCKRSQTILCEPTDSCKKVLVHPLSVRAVPALATSMAKLLRSGHLPSAVSFLRFYWWELTRRGNLFWASRYCWFAVGRLIIRVILIKLTLQQNSQIFGVEAQQEDNVIACFLFRCHAHIGQYIGTRRTNQEICFALLIHVLRLLSRKNLLNIFF